MAKVSDVLKLPVMRGVRVLAGEAGLSGKVEHVTVMEVPEIRQWLKGNDFLITSFYSVRKSEEEQCALIREVADICCCIAVKTGPYVACISERVREEADEVGLPILELPEALPYIDIIVNVMNLIFEEEGNSAILEKYVKDILYENYSDRVLMAERGRLFGMDVEHDWFAAVVINFRKMVVPDEQDWKGIRFLARAVLGLFRERTEITECIRIPLKKGRRRGGGQGQGGPCGSVYGGEDPGTLGCRGGPDRLCGRIGPERSYRDPGYIQRCVSGDPGPEKALAGDECLSV